MTPPADLALSRLVKLCAAAIGLLAVALVVSAQPAQAKHKWRGTFTRHTLAAGATYPTRDYYVYVPVRLAPAAKRALVVFLHGCTQSAVETALGARWNDVADRHGFVVVYPDQRVPPPDDPSDVDGSSAQCWNAGQSAVFPRGEGEIESVAQITRSVARKFRADRRRVFVMGISGGALMATTMAATYPDMYAAVGSVEGCPYLCADLTGHLAYQRMGTFARVVPAFLVHGTADYIFNPALGAAADAQWVGTNDLADNGSADGSLARAPAMENHGVDSVGLSPGATDACVHVSPPKGNNPCPGRPLGWSSYPYTRHTYSTSNGEVLVESWFIHGLSHNYPGGDPEGTFVDPLGPDVTSAAYAFFVDHAR